MSDELTLADRLKEDQVQRLRVNRDAYACNVSELISQRIAAECTTTSKATFYGDKTFDLDEMIDGGISDKVVPGLWFTGDDMIFIRRDVRDRLEQFGFTVEYDRDWGMKVIWQTDGKRRW